MLKVARTTAFLILSLLSLAGAAQPLHFGDYAPLTNTRYGTIAAQPQLVSNGNDTVLFWRSMNSVRAARLVDGERRVGHSALQALSTDLSAAWTDQQFLVAATEHQMTGAIAGRLLDSAGNPLAEQFRISATGRNPRIASNGQRVLMLYQDVAGLHAAVLTPQGNLISSVATGVRDGVVEYSITSNGDGFTAIVTTQHTVRIVTFDRNGTMVSVTSLANTPLNTFPRESAIASNGDSYLAVWTEGATGVHAATVTRSGTASNAAMLETAGNASAPAVAWAGDHYEIGYLSATGSTAEIRLLRVNALTAQLIDKLPATTKSRVSLAHTSGRTRVAWSTAPLGVVNVRDTGATGEGTAATYGAADQNLLDTATSTTSTLFVWYELADNTARFFAGARDVNGNWNERQFGSNLETSAIAATNGSDFMIVARDDRDWLAWRIGASGDPIGQGMRFTPRGGIAFNALTWNGQSYVLTGIDSQKRVVAALLSIGGFMSPPVVVRVPGNEITLDNPVVASDGTNTVLAWSESLFTGCFFPPCNPSVDGINYRLLGPNLELLGDSPHMVVNDQAQEPHVVFANDEYLVVWPESYYRVRAARIARDGRRTGPIFNLAESGYRGSLDAVSLGNRVAVGWSQSRDNDSISFEQRVLVLRTDGTILGDATLPKQLRHSLLLARLPDNRVAHAMSIQQSAAPHHGASRIVLATADHIAPPARPGVPSRLYATLDGLTATLTWTRATGDVNGYRVEYRVGDGSWNEVERWLGPDETTTTVRLTRSDLQIVFRVRAFNDAGTGNYSVSGGGAPRRRSVR